MYQERLDCEGPDDRSEYLLRVEKVFTDYICRVWSIPYPEDHQFFELDLKPLDEGTLQVVGIYSHVDRYRRKGIPDALLPRMCELLRSRIRSSPKSGEQDALNQWRTREATKMWDRLVEEGAGLL